MPVVRVVVIVVFVVILGYYDAVAIIHLVFGDAFIVRVILVIQAAQLRVASCRCNE